MHHTLFFLLGLLLSGGSTTCSGTASSSTTTSATRGNGGKLAGALSDQLKIMSVHAAISLHIQNSDQSYLVDILALKLGDEGL